jgi:hypothetical protein
MRRPMRTVPGGVGAGWGGGAGGGPGFPGSATAAAAGAMLGIGAADFCRPSSLLPTPPPPLHPLADGSTHNRRARSRSCSGNDNSTFPLHIL